MGHVKILDHQGWETGISKTTILISVASLFKCLYLHCLLFISSLQRLLATSDTRILFQIHTAPSTTALAKICRRRPPVCCTLYDSSLQHASSSSFPQHRHTVYLCVSAVRLHIQSSAEIKAAPRHLHHRLTKKHWVQPLPHTDAFLDDTSHQGHLTWTGTERSTRDRVPLNSAAAWTLSGKTTVSM